MTAPFRRARRARAFSHYNRLPPAGQAWTRSVRENGKFCKGVPGKVGSLPKFEKKDLSQVMICKKHLDFPNEQIYNTDWERSLKTLEMKGWLWSFQYWILPKRQGSPKAPFPE
jgi:hypothetical protein